MVDRFTVDGRTGMSARYILRFDDVCPWMAWSKFLPLKDRLEQLNVRCVLGVVPDCRDETLMVEPDPGNFYNRVRQWASKGDTIAQHGVWHVCDSGAAGILGINPRSEFAGHDYETQLKRLAIGKNRLEREGVWQPWFMAPAHSFDLHTLIALKELGFEAITDGYGFYPYRLHSMLAVPQLVSFPLPLNFGYQTVCVHINGLDETGIEKLMGFVERLADAFVDFKSVVASHATGGVASAVLRILSARVLGAKRRLDRRRRHVD